VKDAATEAAAFKGTVHGPVPEQAPDQPTKIEPRPGVAVSVTVVPAANDVEHVNPQLMPVGLLVTVPLPLAVTVKGNMRDCEGLLEGVLAGVCDRVLTPQLARASAESATPTIWSFAKEHMSVLCSSTSRGRRDGGKTLA